MFKVLPIKRGTESIQALFGEIQKCKAVIAGGYARYCLSPSANPVPAKDIDIFMSNTDANLVNKLSESIQHLGHLKIFESELAITFSENPQIQIIKPRIEKNFVTCGSIEEILSNFDFSICRAALTSLTEGLVDEHFESDELARRLQIKFIHNPVVEVTRFIKYGKKGYKFENSEIVKVLNDWKNRSSLYRLTLQDIIVEDPKPRESLTKEIQDRAAELKSANNSANSGAYY